ncbi:MAG: hypothetical protein WB992_24605 [Bryobacteraceae bacterium]
MESSVVRGLIAQIERELFFVPAKLRLRAETSVLHQQGATAEPMMLRHFFDEDDFGCADRFVLATEVEVKCVEVGLVFPSEDGEVAVETVTESVFGGSGFALLGFGAGALLSVGLIGGDLSFC